MKTETPLVTLPHDARLEEVKIVISQELDCCSDSTLDNTLTVETPESGDGKYLILSGRWAMSDEAEVDELATFLKEVIRRVN